MNEVKRINFSELLLFCGQDETRADLLRPWVGIRDGVRRLYATDGKILVEAHPDDLCEELDWDFVYNHGGPGYDAITYLSQRLDAVTLDQRAVGINHPDLPEIVTVSDPCKECAGEGSRSCVCPDCSQAQHECEWCHGSGRVASFEPAAVPIYGHWISSLNLEQLRKLPRVLFLSANDGHLGQPFVWGEKGRGLVMPMRATATATAETVLVRAKERRVA